MGWLYNSDDLKTKEDYINQLKEIVAYRELDGEDFDFGTGLIKNEMSFGSEDAYYKMDIQTLEEVIRYWNYSYQESKEKKKERTHKRYLKQKEKNRIDFLYRVSWSNVVDRKDWKQKVYRGKRSSYLKKLSNKKIRKYKKGLPVKSNTHYKIFDFWWELY